MNLISMLFGKRSQHVSPAAAIAELTGRPLLMAPGSLENLVSAALMSPRKMETGDGWVFEGSTPDSLIEVEDGIGVLKVHGPLFHRWSIMAWWFGGTGYDVIGAAFAKLVADPAVKTIILDVDSPGGHAAGCADVADAIFAARGTKPILAGVNDNAFSAAYWIASAADSIHVSRTSGVGSIGVVSTHIDISQWDAKVGVAYEYIHAGDKKVDHSMHRPLSKSARADMQAEVDRLYGMFVDAVARNRGMEADAVRSTQAGVYFGETGVSAGLADKVSTLPDLVAQLVAVEDEEEEAPEVPGMQAAQVAAGDELTAAVETVAADLAAVQPEPPATPAAEQVTEATEVTAAHAMAEALSASDLPPPAQAALLKAKDIKKDQIEARLAHARQVLDACHAAHLDSCATGYIERGTAIETVRAELSAAVVGNGEEISNTLPQKNRASEGTLSSSAIYQQRRAAASALSAPQSFSLTH